MQLQLEFIAGSLPTIAIASMLRLIKTNDERKLKQSVIGSSASVCLSIVCLWMQLMREILNEESETNQEKNANDKLFLLSSLLRWKWKIIMPK